MFSQHHQIISTGKAISSLSRTFKKRKIEGERKRERGKQKEKEKERERQRGKETEEKRQRESKKTSKQAQKKLFTNTVGHLHYIFIEALSNQYIDECDAEFSFSLIFFVTK